MAAWMLALALVGLLLGECATGPGRTSAPGFQDKGESGRNGGMGAGPM
jgi:hypothetical protein